MLCEPCRDSAGVVSILDGGERSLHFAGSSPDNQGWTRAVHEYPVGHASKDSFGKPASSAHADDDKVGGKVIGAVEDELSGTADFVNLPDARDLWRDHSFGTFQELAPGIHHRIAEVIVPLHIGCLGHDGMFQNS
jgi:hypothetical protein